MYYSKYIVRACFLFTTLMPLSILNRVIYRAFSGFP